MPHLIALEASIALIIEHYTYILFTYLRYRRSTKSTYA